MSNTNIYAYVIIPP